MRRVLLIPGSLRRLSINLAVLRTVRLVAPDGIVAELYTGLGNLPLFDPDADEEPLDAAVADLRGRVHAADALLLSTPEYAAALPGPFKNLLDWTVGDDKPGSVYEKPVGWVNVSPRGAVHAHESLRRVLQYVHADVVEPACVHIPVTPDRLDTDGLVADPAIRDRLAQLVALLGARAEEASHDPDWL